MTTPDRNADITGSIVGSTIGSGAAVAMGRHARASAVTAGTPESMDVMSAVAALRAELARLPRHDDDDADRWEDVDTRLRRLEKAASKPTPDTGRLRRLLSEVTSGLAGVTALAVGVEALRTAVEKLIR